MERSRKREYIKWDGHNLEDWGLYLSDFSETPPEPKTTIVEIPYGDNIDITESLTGDVQYSRRQQKWTLTLLGNPTRAKVQKAYTNLLNNMHGKTKTFKLSWDEGATYTGRATVEENEQMDAGDVAQYTVSLDCEPWRDLGVKSYLLQGIGYVYAYFAAPRHTSTFTVQNNGSVRYLICFDNGTEDAHQYTLEFEDKEIPLALKEGQHTATLIPLTGSKMRMYTDVISDFNIASMLNSTILKTTVIHIIYSDLDTVVCNAKMLIPWKEL